MDRLVLLESTALPFPVDNVDTDVITPIRRILEGLPSMVEHAFEPLRFAADGSLNPACALNDPRLERRRDPAGRSQLRLRKLARDGGVGRARPGLPLRHRAELRRH